MFATHIRWWPEASDWLTALVTEEQTRGSGSIVCQPDFHKLGISTAANGKLSRGCRATFQGLASLAHPYFCPRTAQHFISRDCSHRLILLSCDALDHATTHNGKAKRRASFKPVSVRVRTSLSTRVSVDVRKKNFEARDFGLFEAQVRAGRDAETANVEPAYRVTCGNDGNYLVVNYCVKSITYRWWSRGESNP